jgi:hypothetical protein
MTLFLSYWWSKLSSLRGVIVAWQFTLVSSPQRFQRATESNIKKKKLCEALCPLWLKINNARIVTLSFFASNDGGL